MIALIQRVLTAHVTINNQIVASIESGVLAFVAIQASDTPKQVNLMADRIMNYRIFPDNAGKMNLSLLDVGGGVLFVPQFTLIADTRRGCRPSFSNNVSSEMGQQMFNQLLDYTKTKYNNVKHGLFGADMQVSLVNDGPVTFWLEN
ncbi:MAG: D-aminoacyl-tRNA deacylase [Pseudomonadota bacterium]